MGDIPLAASHLKQRQREHLGYGGKREHHRYDTAISRNDLTAFEPDGNQMSLRVLRISAA